MSPTPVDSAVHPRTLLYAVHSNLVSTRHRLFSHLSINRFNRYPEEGSTNTGTDCLRKQMKLNAWYIIIIIINVGFLANPWSLTSLKCSPRCLTLLILMSQMVIFVGRECISELLSASLSSRIVGFSVISLAPHRAPNNRDQDTKLTSLLFSSLLFS